MLENINNCGILTSHNIIITEQYSKPIYFTYHIFYYCKCVYLKNEIPQTTFNKTLCTTSIQQVENTDLEYEPVPPEKCGIYCDCCGQESLIMQVFLKNPMKYAAYLCNFMQ